MLDLREEIHGLKRARDEKALLRLLSDALTSSIAPNSLDLPTQRQLLQLAAHHGVLGLFALHGSEGPLRTVKAQYLRALKFTHRVVEALSSAEIPVVVLKGVAAGRVWSDPSVRQQGDVDVLIAKKHQHLAAEVLVEKGVCAQRFLTAQSHHNDTLNPRDPYGFLVEVHHYFNPHHPARMNVAELLERRIWFDTPIGKLPALAPEDDAVYLAVHATTSAFRRMAWLVDLAYLPADWSVAAQRAKNWNLAPAVLPAWRRTRQSLKVPIPEAAFDKLASLPGQETLSNWALELADATHGQTRRFWDAAYRVLCVHPQALPRVLRQKMMAREEERRAYEGLQKSTHAGHD